MDGNGAVQQMQHQQEMAAAAQQQEGAQMMMNGHDPNNQLEDQDEMDGQQNYYEQMV